MEEAEVTTGEVAANLMGAKGVRNLVCIWIDESERVTYYRIGSMYESLGMLRILTGTLERRVIDGDNLEGDGE